MERLGGPPDLVLVADCIFVPLYGESNPLMDVLSQLVPAEARDASILIAAERRPGCGGESLRAPFGGASLMCGS